MILDDNFKKEDYMIHKMIISYWLVVYVYDKLLLFRIVIILLS